MHAGPRALVLALEARLALSSSRRLPSRMSLSAAMAIETSRSWIRGSSRTAMFKMCSCVFLWRYWLTRTSLSPSLASQFRKSFADLAPRSRHIALRKVQDCRGLSASVQDSHSASRRSTTPCDSAVPAALQIKGTNTADQLLEDMVESLCAGENIILSTTLSNVSAAAFAVW